ncbi:MAG: GHMP kinase [Nitrospinaceae bacterium]
MIRSSAPTRIDLAGGTLDIWPLYLFFDNPPTLNAAIDLYATVELKPRNDRQIMVESKDLNLRERFASIQSLPEKHPLDLILKTLKFYRPLPSKGMEVITDCRAPQGSGIGGSSALNIALHGAFNAWTGNRYRKPQILEIARNIETQVISVPAGWQDYFPALYGGLLAVQPGLSGVTHHPLTLDPAELTRRFVLCYTGKPRQSGINNWEVFKKVIEGENRTRRCLREIGQAARKIETSLKKKQWRQTALWMEKEWRARKALAPGISTPHMDRLIRAAMSHGALAGKVCGAGGGGCVAFLVKKGSRDKVAQALEQQGGKVLPFRFVRRGLQVERG